MRLSSERRREKGAATGESCRSVLLIFRRHGGDSRRVAVVQNEAWNVFLRFLKTLVTFFTFLKVFFNFPDVFYY